jgi:hypothetical protein
VADSISFSENQNYRTNRRTTQIPSKQHLHTQKQILALNAGKRVVNPLELVTCQSPRDRSIHHGDRSIHHNRHAALHGTMCFTTGGSTVGAHAVGAGLPHPCPGLDHRAPATGPVFAHYKVAYYAILAFVLFVAVPVELSTAFCLPRCSPRLRQGPPALRLRAAPHRHLRGWVRPL